MGRDPCRRRGAALVLVVLLVLAFTLMGHGLLVLATSEFRSSASGGVAIAERLVARAALEVGVSRLLESDSLPRLSSGARSMLPVAPGRVEVEGAAPEVVLVEASAVEGPGRSLIAGVWGLDPVIRAGGRKAVVEAGAQVFAAVGAVRAGGFWDDATHPACAPLQPRLDSLDAALGPPRPEGALSGRDPEGLPQASSVAARTLGLLGPDSLARRLSLLLPGMITPGPSAVGSACAPEPTNWGSPTDVQGPCSSRRIGLQSTGPVEIRGGEGQGLLLVEGDLSLQEGAFFAGLVLVGGDLEMSGDSRLRGAARAGGSVRIEDGSMVVGAACPIALALASIPALLRPVRIPEPPTLLH